MSRKPIKASKADGLVKARDKVTRKMSRDGLIERNAATGEDVRVSKRELDADLKGGKQPGDTYLQLDNRSADATSKRKKQKQRRIAERSARAENTANADVQPQTAPAADDNSKQADEQQLNQHHVPQKVPSVKSKPPPIINEPPVIDVIGDEPTPPTEQTGKLIDAPRSALKHEDGGKLQFKRGGKPAPASQRKQKRPQQYKPETAEQSDSADSLPLPDTPLHAPEPAKLSETPQSALKHESPDRLHFEQQGDEVKSPGSAPKRRQAAPKRLEPIADGNQAAPQAETSSAKPDPAEPPQTSGGTETHDTPLHAEKTAAPLKPDKPGKLQFTEDETPPKIPSRGEVRQQKKYGKAQAKADKSVSKLDKAKSKLPAKKKLRSKRVLNEETGKAKRKLYFESEVKSQSEHLKGAKPLRPVKAAGNSALAFGHRKMYQVERENVATEAAHKGEMAAEGGVRSALRHHKTAPYRKVQKLERTAQKKTVNAAYQKALAENPKLKSNLLSRAFQKRKIKKDYAKAAREAKKTAERAKKAGGFVADAGKALAGIVKRHPVAAAVIVLLLLLLFCLMSLIGAFGGAGGGGLGGILTASYLAEDADIDNAELVYTEWETDLQIQIANTETSHPGYDEYRYNIGDISHNPYELMAYLTAKYQNFNAATAQTELAALFGEQYALTFTPTTETRYADPTDADEDGDYEPYDWKILTVTLTARNFSDVVSSRLSGEQLPHYALLLQTKGSRQYLANPFGDMNWLPYVTSYYGYRIHPISGEKNYHKGVDIGLPTGTPIQSGQDGVVTFAGYSGDYGNVVVIEDDKGLVSKYAHCDTLNVTVGQTVKAGDVIATVGNTGNSTGAHLHLEILKNGQYLNALYFADSGSFSLTPTYGYAGTPMGDGTYAALIAEAEKYLNYPYVWGGSSPSTSFDCSGYVSYVLRASGVKDVGRLGATGLYNISMPVSPSDARPGDLVFFHSTYSTPNPVTHVGIYVGTDASGRPKMLHCGSPIQYTYIDTAYWQQHFFAFGRIN
jgi:murein DD-endopeptidase MepM/ murein hydrolase activator NlpD